MHSPTHMTNSQNATSGKCFSGIIRRLLCTGSLPTHPSDNYLPEFDQTEFTHLNKTSKTGSHEVQPPPTPGIVARLMGLDSFPDINRAATQRTTLDSIMRSRSVNSVDYLPQFDLTQLSQHRRVRTSVSFREVPTFLPAQNHDFFVLCFDKFDEVSNEEGLNLRKPEVGFREIEGKKVERGKNNKNMREKVPAKKRENQENNKKSCTRRDEAKRVSANKPTAKVEKALFHKKDVHRKPRPTLKAKNLKEASVVGLKCANQKKGQYTQKANSSPISVASVPGRKGLISRKKSSTKNDKFSYPCPDFIPTLNADDEDKPLTTGESDYYIQMLVNVFRLTEEDAKGFNFAWEATEVFKYEDFEEICLQFGEEILQMLLNQLVNELCCTSIIINSSRNIM